MTRESFDVWISSVHATGVVPDGEDFRPACSCGWMGLPYPTEAAARREGCEVEEIQQEGRARLAAYVARRERTHA